MAVWYPYGNMTIKKITITQYKDLIQLWNSVEGMGLSDADSEGGIAAYLKRNPGLSFAAWEANRCIGTVLCGHDGRRGYLHHLAVHDDYRKQGIGRALLNNALDELSRLGIQKCHIFVYTDNFEGREFWTYCGWEHRHDIQLYSKVLGSDGSQV